MQYQIVKNHDGPISLQLKIESMIRQGWTPIGGVTVDHNDNFYQALVKEDKP